MIIIGGVNLTCLQEGREAQGKQGLLPQREAAGVYGHMAGHEYERKAAAPSADAMAAQYLGCLSSRQ